MQMKQYLPDIFHCPDRVSREFVGSVEQCIANSHNQAANSICYGAPSEAAAPKISFNIDVKRILLDNRRVATNYRLFALTTNK